MGKRSCCTGFAVAMPTHTAIRTPGRACLVALFAAATLGSPASGQDVTELLGAGRYEEAAALLAGVGPQTAYVGAEMIFERAHGTDYQNGDFANAVRGFTAGATVPHLTERQRQRFDFWHGAALVSIVRRDLETSLGREEALAMLEEAYMLLLSGKDYAAGIDQSGMAVNVARLINEISAGR